MPSKSKRKGNTYERSLVHQAQAVGLDAERAWGSDGHALGASHETDLLVAGLRGQAKIRKTLPKYLYGLLADVDFAVMREDRAESLVLLRWRDFLEIVKNGGV